MAQPRSRRVPVDQRDRLIRQLSELFRDVDLALYLAPGAIQREGFRDDEFAPFARRYLQEVIGE